MPNQMMGVTPLLGVFDMPTSIAFYCGMLGFDVVSASPVVETPEGRFSHWMWLRLGNVDLMLNTAYDAGERPIERDASRIAGHVDTCLFIGCSDLDDAHAQFTRVGLEIEPPKMAAYGLRRFSLRDPDNFELVFQEA